MNVCNWKNFCKKKASTSPTCRERPLIRKTGWGTTERGGVSDRWTERVRKKGEDAVRAFMKKRIDVDNVQTTYFDNCISARAYQSSLLWHAVQLTSPSSLVCSLLSCWRYSLLFLCFCQLLHPSMCEAYCRCQYALRGILVKRSTVDNR